MKNFFASIIFILIATSQLANAQPLTVPTLSCKLEKYKPVWISIFKYEAKTMSPYVYINGEPRFLQAGEYSIVSNLFEGGQLIFKISKNNYENEKIVVHVKDENHATVTYDEKHFECIK